MEGRIEQGDEMGEKNSLPRGGEGETVHAIMENKFYIEKFKSQSGFIRKAATYQNFFNYVRKNSRKENKCPFNLVREKDLNILPKNLHLSPVYLNELLRPLKPKGFTFPGLILKMA